MLLLLFTSVVTEVWVEINSTANTEVWTEVTGETEG